jgi:hypothetical protein
VLGLAYAERQLNDEQFSAKLGRGSGTGLILQKALPAHP